MLKTKRNTHELASLRGFLAGSAGVPPAVWMAMKMRLEATHGIEGIGLRQRPRRRDASAPSKEAARRVWTYGYFQSLLLGMFACLLISSPAHAQEGKITAAGPRGLFLMNKAWVSMHSVERVAWYFADDGQVYARLETGISPADLAAHKGRKGACKFEGKQMAVTWADGKTVTKPFTAQPSGTSFEWDGGLYLPAPPLTDLKQIAGRYSTGLTNVGKGMGTLVSTFLEFHSDGTFARLSAPLGENPGPATPFATGTWKAASYSITLTGSDGTLTRKIAFPFFEDSKGGEATQLFYGGVLMKKL